MKKLIWIPETEKVCPIASIQYINYGRSKWADASKSTLRIQLVSVDGSEIPIAIFNHQGEEKLYQFTVSEGFNIGDINLFFLKEHTKAWPKYSTIVFIPGDNRSTLTYYPDEDFNRFCVYTITGDLNILDLAAPACADEVEV